MKSLKITLALLLTLALAFSALACGNKGKTDPKATFAPFESDEAYEAARAALAFTLGEYSVTAGEIEDSYYDYVNMMQYYGMPAPATDEEIADIVNSSMDQFLIQYYLLYLADEWGIELSDEELAEVAAAAEEERLAYVEGYTEDVRASYEDSGAAMPDEASLLAEAMERLESDAMYYIGTSFDEFIENYGDSMRVDLRIGKVQERIEGEIEVSDEDLQAYYDTLLAQQMTGYAENASMYKYDVTTAANPVLWTPEGYARVSIITIAPEGGLPEDYETNAATLADLEAEYGRLMLTNEDPARQAEIRTEYAELKASRDLAYAEYSAGARTRADEAFAELKDGADFDVTMGKYNAYEDADVRLVYLTETDADFVTELWDAIGALELGQFSEIIEVNEVFYIVQLTEKLESKATPFADATEELRAAVLGDRLENFWAEAQTNWLVQARAIAIIYEEAIAYIGKVS
ncbi:MAG: peptidylprolyl isomerase [Clostridiales bacterium]|nr:peptidylprolyl isomerase [Clostridiales bacterium]